MQTTKPFSDPDEKEIEQKMIKTILGMPKEVQDRFKVLHMLSDQRSKLNDEFNEACSKLEQKIRDQKQPLLEKRHQIVQGTLTDFGDLPIQFDETHKDLEKKVAAIVKSDKPEEKEAEKVPLDVSYLKGKQGIPDFWLRAMKSNKLIWDQVKERDEPIMEFVSNIETKHYQDTESKNMFLKLLMEFTENDYFTPQVLECILEYHEEDECKAIKATEIQWKDGKDPTKKKIKKKQKHKKTGETRTVVKTVDADSFFNIFKSREAPLPTADQGSDDEHEQQEKIDEVQQIVEDFHDLLVPEALEYYLGLNEDFDMFMNEDEEDEDDSDEDGSDSDKDKKKKSKKEPKDAGATGDAADGAEDGKKQECKQQ